MGRSRVCVLCTIAVSCWLAGSATAAPDTAGPATLRSRIDGARDDLRRQAEALLQTSPPAEVVQRLMAQAAEDESVAFERVNLAAVVAALGGDDERALELLDEEMPPAPDAALDLVLGRHALVLELGKPALADTSHANLARQMKAGRDPASDRLRVATLLGGVELLTPDALACANLAQNAGNLYAYLGDLDVAEAHFEKALALQSRLEPGGLNMAITLISLGTAKCNRGDLEQGRALFEQSLAIVTQRAPGSLYESGILTNLGLICASMGDIDAALGYHQRGLVLVERVDPGGVLEGQIRLNIGNLQQARGDLEGALRNYRRSLEIMERDRPDSTELAQCLRNLGVVHDALGERETALAFRQRDVEITGRLVPDSLEFAEALQNRGCLLADLGDDAGAFEDCRRGLEIIEALAPDSLRHAQALLNVGWGLEDRGETDAAQASYEQSVAIAERLVPCSADCAQAHTVLGMFLERHDQPGRARNHFARAVDVIEKVRYTSGANAEARSSFMGEWIGAYRSLVRVLMRLGDTAAAADVTERMRARTLLDDLAERSFASDLPPELKARRGSLEAQRQNLYAQLRGLQGPPPSPDEAEELTAALERASLDEEALTREIRSADPRYASLQYPRPASVADLCRKLDPGTVALSFVAGNTETWLFAFGRELPVRAFRIPLAGDALWDEVEKCLAAVQGAKDRLADEAEPRQSLAALGRTLLSEAEPALAGAQRLLVLPDGPLWLLPFQALILADGSYLSDRWPIHYAPSATAIVEGRRLRTAQPAGAPNALLALGDPDFSLPASADRGHYIPIRGEAFAAGRGGQAGVAFERLAYSGAEVAAIGDLFGNGARVRQGTRATEACVRQEGPGSRVIHLATHGLLDPAMPMESAVVLTIPRDPKPDNDGFLKAWKVLGLDLKRCDLVTLSACETARGRIRSGEGIIGLTRAFLYAGASSVVCTQWSVADDSTAALMVRFYTHYRAGAPKDLALRDAMGEIRTGKLADGSALPLPSDIGPWRPQWAQPCHWAPFVLVGDFVPSTL